MDGYFPQFPKLSPEFNVNYDTPSVDDLVHDTMIIVDKISCSLRVIPSLILILCFILYKWKSY